MLRKYLYSYSKVQDFYFSVKIKSRKGIGFNIEILHFSLLTQQKVLLNSAYPAYIDDWLKYADLVRHEHDIQGAQNVKMPIEMEFQMCISKQILDKFQCV